MMLAKLEKLEKIAKKAHGLSIYREIEEPVTSFHPFDLRNISPKLPTKVRQLFDDGHFAEATFEAFKYLDKEIQRHSGIQETGHKLMMQVFKEGNPTIKLNSLVTESEKDEQMGYKFIFAGAMSAIRNPRGHEHSINDDIDTCLDHLGFVSMLLRRLSEAGYK